MLIEPHTLLMFLTVVVAICVTPGPDMLYILANSLTRGPGAGMAAACGMALGMLGHTIAATLGLSVLLATVPLAFEIVRYAGVAYLLWLAVKSFGRRRSRPTRSGTGRSRSGGSSGRGWRRTC